MERRERLWECNLGWRRTTKGSNVGQDSRTSLMKNQAGAFVFTSESKGLVAAGVGGLGLVLD